MALIVRPPPTGLELLLIRRAEREGDPWSGHMALPGGREEAADAGPLHTAVRETHEEVGIPLDTASLLGRLDDVSPISGAPRIPISAWVFGVPPETIARKNKEVDLALWVPLDTLLDAGSSLDYLHPIPGGDTVRFPAFGYQGHVVWGLTHRILSQFLEIARTDSGSGDAI
ncbi:CoA pyrophosphatase [soil metagenome]